MHSQFQDWISLTQTECQVIRSAGLSFIEMMYIVLGSISFLNPIYKKFLDERAARASYDGSEPSPTRAETPGNLPRANFYLNEIFSGAVNFEEIFSFLKHHTFPRLALVERKPNFRRTKIFTHEVVVLGIICKMRAISKLKKIGQAWKGYRIDQKFRRDVLALRSNWIYSSMSEEFCGNFSPSISTDGKDGMSKRLCWAGVIWASERKI